MSRAASSPAGVGKPSQMRMTRNIHLTMKTPASNYQNFHQGRLLFGGAALPGSGTTTGPPGGRVGSLMTVTGSGSWSESPKPRLVLGPFGGRGGGLLVLGFGAGCWSFFMSGTCVGSNRRLVNGLLSGNGRFSSQRLSYSVYCDP
jgi:hypothetical protein